MSDTPTPVAPETTAPPAAPESTETRAPSSIQEASQRFRQQMAGVPDQPVGEVTDTDPNAPSWERPRDPATGQFTRAEETATPDAAAAAAPEEGELAPEAQGEAEAESPEPVVVTLPAIGDRGGQAEEVQIALDPADPQSAAIADRLRFLANNGMRRQEFERQMASVQTQRAELEDFVAEWETVPEAVIGRMREDIQDRVFRALLPLYIERQPQLIEAWYNDESARRLGVADLKTQTVEDARTLEQARQARARGREVQAAVEQLIPSAASEEDVADFRADALRYLADLDRRGEPVTKENVRDLLASRLRRYGFSEPAGPGSESVAAATPKKPAPVIARPVGDTAERLKAARNTPARLQELKATQAAAAKTPPAGQGAAPAQPLRPPPNLTITEASKWYRKHGGQSWLPPAA